MSFLPPSSLALFFLSGRKIHSKNCTPPGFIARRSLDCRKTFSGFFDKYLQSAACIICPLEADKFHTGSLRCIFCQVHALAENDLIFFAAFWRRTLRGFFDTLTPPGFIARRSRFFNSQISLRCASSFPGWADDRGSAPRTDRTQRTRWQCAPA